MQRSKSGLPPERPSEQPFQGLSTGLHTVCEDCQVIVYAHAPQETQGFARTDYFYLLILGGRPFGHESVNPLEVFEVGEINSDLAVFATDGYPHRRLQMLGKKTFEFKQSWWS